MSGETTETSIDFAYDAGLKKIDEQLKSVESLDTKMGVLIGFLGALIVGLLAALLASDPAKVHNLISRRTVEIGFAATAMLLAGDLYFAFQAFRMRRLYSGVRFQDLVTWADEELKETKRAFLPTLIQAVNRNEERLKVKQRHALHAVWLVFVTLLALLTMTAMVGVRLAESSGG